MDEEAHRAYMRTYMRERRARFKKAREDKPPTTQKPVEKPQARLKLKSNQTQVDTDAVQPPTPINTPNPTQSLVKHHGAIINKSTLVSPIWKKDQAEGSKRKHST